jgi:hypothetical protein
MDDAIASHCRELNRCNQRGGRMLSVFDLLGAGTLDLELASYLMARLIDGASFMVGASPGGAGKTTVMGALLNLLPVDVTLLAATPEVLRSVPAARNNGRLCLICHEIGAGDYFAYLWGETLRRYCRLVEDPRFILATNLHADDVDEARTQLCEQNGVLREHFNAFDLLVFLRVERQPWRPQRRIGKVYDASKGYGHRPIYDAARKPALHSRVLHESAIPDEVTACRRFLEENLAAGTTTIEQTRRAVLAFLRERTG